VLPSLSLSSLTLTLIDTHTLAAKKKKFLYCPMLSPLSLTVTTQFLSHRNYFSIFLSQCGFSFAQMSETAIHGVKREREREREGERRKSRVLVYNPVFFTLCELV
jgi:hypothetical protein